MNRISSLIAAMLLTAASRTQGQGIVLPAAMSPGIYQPGTTLQQVVSALNANAMPGDTSEGGFTDRMNAFQKFWQGRVAVNDATADSATNTNMFSQYYQALRGAIAARELAGCGTSGFHGDWQVLGPDTFSTQVIGKVDAVWADPNDSNYILAGTVGGLFRTTNGGATWTAITDNAPIVTGVTGITCIAVSPVNRDTIYLGATGYNYGAGILKTYNGGATWQQEFISHSTPPSFYDSIQNVSKIYFTEDNARLYAICNKSIYTRLTNSTTWDEVTPPVPADSIYGWGGLAFVPGHADHFFVSGNHSRARYAIPHSIYTLTFPVPTGYIWESVVAVPASSDWKNITPTFTDTVIFGDYYKMDTDIELYKMSVPDTNNLYIVCVSLDQQYGNLSKYSFGSSTPAWKRINNALNQPNDQKMELLVSPANPNYIYYGDTYPFFSSSGGLYFNLIGEYNGTPTHGDIRGICLQKATNGDGGASDRTFFATDGGVSKKPSGVDASLSSDLSTIDISGQGLACGEFWSVATSEAGGLVVGGMQHDGLVAYEPTASPKWAADPNGASDAGTCNFDNFDRHKVYGESNGYDSSRAQSESAGGRIMGDWVNEPASAHEAGSLPPPPIFIDAFNTQYEGVVNLFRKKNWEPKFNPMSTDWGLPTDSGLVIAMCIDPYLRTPFLGDTLPVGYVVFQSHPNTLYYLNNPITGGTFIKHYTSGDSTYPITITGIAMDPANPQKVWVSEGNLNPNISNSQKVQYSPDGGSTWYDVSYGLPLHVPVSNIIYEEGSSDVLFCATEVGIYTCNMSTFNAALSHNNIEWECFSKGAAGSVDFPNAYVTDLKINYCQSKLYAATYGRAIWVSDINPAGTIPTTTTTISTPTNWSGGNQYMNGSIDVQTGVTLTISGNDTLHMPKNGVIKVEPGGKLEVDHSEITNDCVGCMWYGVQAAGHVLEPQTPTSNQGWVVVQNGSTIQHAYMAICNYDTSNLFNSDGGIIQASNSYFINNRNSITFAAYDNWNAAGTVLNSNLSYFNNCTFQYDNNYRGNATGYPAVTSHVSMSGVEWITFAGCQFLNRDGGYGGEGIHSWKSAFNVEPYCPGAAHPSGCTGEVFSRFCGLAYGINILTNDISYDPTININQTNFDSVGIGVYSQGVNSVNTTYCNFKVGNHSGMQTSIETGDIETCYENIGIYEQNATQFNIAYNNFTGRFITSGYFNNFGTVVANSQDNNNNVYLNTYDSLNYGVCAVGRNTGRASGGVDHGLQILCNAFSNNTFDIAIEPDGGTYSQGIAASQGGYVTPAGNSFTGSNHNIVNNNCLSFVYWYYGTTASGSGEPHDYSPVSGPYAISVYEATGDKYCPEGSGSGGAAARPAIDQSTLRTYKQSFYAARTASEDSLLTYNSLIDFGNTANLLSTIAGSTDTAALYATLSSGSPYISKAALKAVADRSALPSQSMKYLLEQNPDDARDGDFLSYIQGVYNFSSNDSTAIMAATQNNTARTSLESAINSAQSAMASDANIIIMALKTPSDTNVSVNDTTGAGICTDSTSVYYTLDSNSFYWGLDSLDTWLQNIGSLWADYERVGYYSWRGNYNHANQIFQSMSSLPMQATDTAEYSTYTTLWNVIYNAAGHGRNIWQLDSADIASLDTNSVPIFTTNTAEEVVRSLTYAINSSPFAIPCAPIFTYPSSKTSHPTKHTPQPIINVNAYNTDYDFEAYPNPTSGVVTFSYNMPAGATGDMKIVVSNIVGEKVWEQHSNGASGKMYWDPGGMPAGVYLYQASSERGIVSNGKLVVVR